MENKEKAPFLRMLKYVRPQWPRVVVIIFTAVLIGFLFSLSFATVGPLLKVMMGEEGLHGWIDRKTCGWRYGLDFYVPDRADFTDVNETDIRFYLLITDVSKDSLAEEAGLKPQDRIVAVGDFNDNSDEKMVCTKLLYTLANTEDENIKIKFSRLDNEGNPSQTNVVQMVTPVKSTRVNLAQKLISFVPRGQSKLNKQQAVVFIILLMAVVTLVRCIARFYQQYLAAKVVQISIAKLREDIFAHIMEMPMGFFSTRGTSDTVSRLLGDTAGTGKGIKILLGKALREPLKAIGTLAFAMFISYKLTLIFLCGAPAIIGLGALLGKRVRKVTKRSLRSGAIMLGKVQGVISALGVVKVYNRQGQESRAYHEINRKFLKQTLRIAKVDAGTGPIMEVLGMIAGSAALLVGAHWVTNSNMEPSSFFVLLILLGTTAESVRKTSDIWNKVQSANAASERVFEIVDEIAEVEKPEAIELSPLKNKIEFHNVIFSYPGSDEPILKGINLTIEAGQTIAVVGPNGSGKTTLVNLLPRFYDVDSGTILIDGQDVKDGTLRSLRDQIGLVTQKVVTFNDTIATNIGYSKSDATQKDVIDAAKRSFAHEFIEPLPEGYASVIREHGAGFSGGQLQRIVIARAILKNPPILIFDEATSQVDADSEAKIHKAISELIHDRTCFIIAHRFSTVISADMIVVMDHGRIVAQGKHSELIKSCQLYQSLYETQLISTETQWDSNDGT